METSAVILALAYLVLAIRENRWCWPAGMASALLYLVVFWRSGLYMQAALQVFYAGMGVYGWWVWRPGTADAPALTIGRWPWRRHALALLAVTTLAVASGAMLSRAQAGAAAPYLDSFTSFGAVLATWMVARKLLENWLYWFVIDAATLGLALAQGLYPTAGLFAVYLALVIAGWRRWLGVYRATGTPP